MPKAIAIVPARGGSKGLPRKNVLPLGGRPLIAWPCAAACQVKELDRVLCSTDDPEIAEAARMAGAEVPFMRPAHLATSEAKVVDVLDHALTWCREQGETYDYVVLLQATSPFVAPEDIRRALQCAMERQADTVITCIDAGRAHPGIMFSIKPDQSVTPLFSNCFYGARRQDFPSYYIRTGAVYVIRSSLITENHRLYGERVFAVPFPEERAVNIDDQRDYAWAEFLLQRRSGAYQS
jgi:CMP-N,N'-diacetyllegionaminic acid synthase